MVHWSLQQYYEGQVDHPLQAIPVYLEKAVKDFDSIGRLWEQEQEIFNEQVSLATGMLDHYYLWQSTQSGLWADSNLEFISLETEFNVPLITPSGRASPRVFLAGRFDGLVRRKDNGTYWLWEVKTAQSIDRLLTSLDNEFQPGVYMMAAEQLMGKKISGVLYNILRKKIPTTPRILNNGRLSQDKSMDTTVEVYAKTIREVHTDWTKEQKMEVYADFLNLLVDKGNTFFLRMPVRRTEGEIEQLRKDIHLISLEMSRPNVHIYPHPNWAHCGRCPFRSPCLMMNGGGNYQAILEAEFQPRTFWDAGSGTEFKEE